MIVKVQAAQAQAVGEPSEPVQGFGFQEKSLGLVPDPPSGSSFHRYFSRHRTYDEQEGQHGNARGVSWGGRGWAERADGTLEKGGGIWGLGSRQELT